LSGRILHLERLIVHAHVVGWHEEESRAVMATNRDR
jgi:hypothetical protein